MWLDYDPDKVELPPLSGVLMGNKDIIFWFSTDTDGCISGICFPVYGGKKEHEIYFTHYFVLPPHQDIEGKEDKMCVGCSDHCYKCYKKKLLENKIYKRIIIEQFNALVCLRFFKRRYPELMKG